MNKGFILNKYSEKVGEFQDAKFNSSGMWSLKSVRVNKDYIDIASKSTKEPYLFILVEDIDKDSFDVIDSMGVGIMFSNSESWCSNTDMIFKKANFIESSEGKYEN